MEPERGMDSVQVTYLLVLGKELKESRANENKLGGEFSQTETGFSLTSWGALESCPVGKYGL